MENSAVSHVPHEAKCSHCQTVIMRKNSGYCKTCHAVYVKNWRMKRFHAKMHNMLVSMTEQLRAT